LGKGDDKEYLKNVQSFIHTDVSMELLSQPESSMLGLIFQCYPILLLLLIMMMKNLSTTFSFRF